MLENHLKLQANFRFLSSNPHTDYQRGGIYLSKYVTGGDIREVGILQCMGIQERIRRDTISVVGRGRDRLSFKGTLGYNTNNHILGSSREANTAVGHEQTMSRKSLE